MIGGTQISWSLRNQRIMDLSSCEAEYMVASYTTCQASCIEMLLEELKLMEPRKIKLFVDNNSTIDLVNQPMCHGQSKHIQKRYHFPRDQVNKEKLEIEHWKTE